MQQLTLTTVIEEIAGELAAERRREAAYVRLARAILEDEPPRRTLSILADRLSSRGISRSRP
jgi:DNA-binding FadR family transcriptional regulator